ncbi:O-antigen ligase family protein [Robertmurraya korlensis]|uniref:O-antigen ligase family protein n=1 Tax=Robertmurraya korlensis TaxID=519977 RepID=UPI00203A5BB4|nr:O-antigen ligase family protein [Robertmurraya korlensis]MCM3602197.1 O-antigen ligase family protein [Robertmurraya korlensis]
MTRDYKLSRNEQTKRILMVLLASLTIIQQMPVLREMFYSEIRVVLYITFGFFSFISLFSINRFLNLRVVQFFIITILYSFLLFLALIISRNINMIMFEYIIPFGILLCSLNTKFNSRQLSKFLIWYIILAAILGVTSIFYYNGGYQISARYMIPSKNQIGPIFGISSIIMGIWILNKRILDFKYSYLLLKIGLFVVLLSTILVVRNRASIVAIVITLLLFLISEYKIKRTLKNLIIFQSFLIGMILLITFGAFDSIIEAFWKSMTLNYDISNINSLSAQRTEVYKQAYSFALNNPILGEIGGTEFTYYTPHNFILNKWVEYGIFGSLPFIFLYLYLWYFTLKSIFSFKERVRFSLPLWVILVSLIVSLFEYTYPFGPGVSQLMVWFLLGQYFKSEYEDY